MTLDNFEHQNSFLWIFCRFWTARHISREINRDRQGQAGYEIFSIEGRFRGSKSRFLRSRKPAHEGIKERSTPVKDVV